MTMVTMTRRALAALSLAVAVPLVVAGQQRPEPDDPAFVFRTGVELINVTTGGVVSESGPQTSTWCPNSVQLPLFRLSRA